MAGKQPELKGRRASALKRQSEGTTSRPVSNVIGRRVRQARLSQNMTLQALYERVQVQSNFELGQPTLTRIELGTRGVYDFEVAALARALQLDARWLLGLIPDDQL